VLRRERFAAIGIATLAFASISGVANADGDKVVCNPRTGVCYVVASTPGAADDGGSDATPAGKGKSGCVGPEGEVPCHDPEFGWFNPVDGCYYKKLDPQPPGTDPVWEGHFPSGAIYVTTCLGVTGTGGGLVWRAGPPPGSDGTSTSPAVLAARAIRQLQLDGPAIGVVPERGGTGLVGLPVWLWTDVTPNTWGPQSVTASVPGLSVTATAKAEQIDWVMGDGHTVVCHTPGTPYADHFGGSSSPTCGHTYVESSASEPGEAYTVTGTTTWRVEWAGGGQSGELTLHRAASIRVRIGELQVLVTKN
jgi:hypothetical protein